MFLVCPVCDWHMRSLVAKCAHLFSGSDRLSLPDTSLLPAVFTSWFESRDWAPRAHQLELFEKVQAGNSALLIAPTGGGKTLAAFCQVWWTFISAVLRAGARQVLLCLPAPAGFIRFTCLRSRHWQRIFTATLKCPLRRWVFPSSWRPAQVTRRATRSSARSAFRLISF